MNRKLKYITCAVRALLLISAAMGIITSASSVAADAPLGHGTGAGSNVTVFGPQQFNRTTGAPNQYTVAFTVPGWVISPFTLHVQNGDLSGNNRISSGTVTLNGTQIIEPSDFNQNVASIDRSVTLQASNTLEVSLASKPGSFIIINVGGTDGDDTAPVIALAAPGRNSFINTTTPAIDLTYSDAANGNIPASGPDVATLKVLLDGADRTNLFTARSGDASATLPASLALSQGPHTITASISDFAGNSGTTTATFTVATTPPSMQFALPAANSYISTNTPTITLQYAGSIAGLDLTSLQVLINNVDRTALFTKSAGSATATLNSASALPPGANKITATIKDVAGNQASASVSFNVDIQPPTISVLQPANGSYFASANVIIAVQYQDDQALDLSSLSATLDGAPVNLTAGANSASGTVTAGVNSSHILTVSIKDKAGNTTSTTSSFNIDTRAPDIQVLQPATGSFSNNTTPTIVVDYSDNDAVDPSTLKVTINGLDETSLFNIQPGSASATLTNAQDLPNGQVNVTASIADLAGNQGTGASIFTVDTQPPAVTFQAPPTQTNSSTPAITFSYSDALSGVDTSSIQLFVDGNNETSFMAVGQNSATGVLQVSPALAEGNHSITVTLSDKAKNSVTVNGPNFRVDTKPPTISFGSPKDNSFINNNTPNIQINYGDGSGVGVDTSTLRVFLQNGSNPQDDITAQFLAGASQASGTIPASSPLADGTYKLTAQIADQVANQGTVTATFQLDTVPPTYQIQSPGPNAFLNSSTPSFKIAYQDDASGVDTSRFQVLVDGVDVTANFAITTTAANGTLNALADGQHQIQVNVFDRAGNQAAQAPQTFTIDTAPPVIIPVVTPQPNAAGWNNAPVTVTFTCTDAGSDIAVCPTPVTISGEGADQPVVVTATDNAGNIATSTTIVNLDLTAPQITAAVSPQPNAGGIIFAPPATVTFTCSDALSEIANCPLPITVSAFGLNQTFSGTVTDVAGNTATATATVSIQAPMPPTISFAASPAPNSAGWNNSDVTVTFACAPGTNPIASCSPPATVSTEGANQQICGNVLDSIGLSASACATINLDKTPPAIVAAAVPPPVNGWNTAQVAVTFTCTDALSGIATCSSPQNVSTNGLGQVVTGSAVDVAGNSANAEVTLNIDQIAPTVLQFTAPSQLAPGQSGTATVTATDNIDVASVVIQLNGHTIATLNAAPYTTTFDAPSDATSGSTLTLTAQVVDIAGNIAASSREIQVVSSGVVTGQVLSDVTSLPLAGANVQVIGGNSQDVSDANGRYSIASNASHLFLSFNVAADPATGTPAMVGVEREIFLQSGVGTVPVDARMTPIAASVSVNQAGGSLVSDGVTIAVPPGAVPSATNFSLTKLSEEGLPALLPLGWSPLMAFDLRSESPTTSSFDANFAQLPTSLILHLVRYDSASHAWTMVTPNLTSVDGTLSTSVPSLGDFALVAADAGSTVPVPPAGQPLTGVSMVMLPAGAIATGTLNPPSIPPSGGTSVATLTVQSSVPMPSGTVIQANVQETYALASGKHLSSAKRSEDIVVYQYAAPTGAAAVAVFPVTPSQTFQPQVFSSGNVHLDILSGRESVRGQVGGSDAVTVTGGDATLTIAAGSLTQDTAIAISPETVDAFLPSSAALIPLSEYNMDFSGETLVSPAQLSVAAGAAQPGDNVLLAQIQRVNGVPYLVVVSLTQVSGSNLITQAVPGLAGITQGGDYVFYKIASPTGFVSGTVTSSSGAVAAMVQSDGLPFVAFSNGSGSYVIPTLTGTVNLTASVPNTALSGSAQAQVTAGQTTTVNLTLSGQTESATITPANGAVGVPLTAEIDITAADSINQSTVTAASVVLTQSGGASVPVRFVFTQNGTRLSVFPVSALQPSSSYTLTASGLATALGGLIAVPSTTFTTQAITPPNFNTNALVFSMPDENGNVQISAPANSFPPGTTVLIVDQTNGVVLSLTVGNDGSVTGQMPATIDDVLAVTITAPDKTTTSFTISKYVAADGATAIGSGGGTVTGPGNLAMIIPPGALNKGTTFKLDLLDQTAFTQLPTWQNLNFGSGMQITAPAMPSFNKEVKLAFPVPAGAPQGTSYYVFRILTDQNNNVLFETIDQAFVQGTGANAQVVTASPPFCGYMNSYGNFQAAASASFSPIATAIVKTFMMWDFDPNQPGVSSTGLIVGKIFQTPGGSNPSFSPLVAPVSISLTNNPHYVTTSDPNCGTYSLFDPQRGGGTRSVTATYQVTGQTIVATASEVNGIQVNDTDYDVTAGLESQYQNIGRLNFTFTPPTPPPPPPQLNIRLYTLDGNGHRVSVSGILQTGTNIVIAFQSKLTIESASIGTTQLSVETPDSAENAITDNLPEQHLLNARVQGLQALSSPGTYVIAATALDPVTLTQVSGSVSVLVVAAGGGNNTAFTCSPPVTSCKLPSVIDSSPINGATGVSPSVFPQITFDEPVKQVTTENVVLRDSTGTSVPIQLIGTKSDGTIANPVQPGDAITALTIEPANGLQFSQTYTLTLNAKENSTGCIDGNGNISTLGSDGSQLIVDTNTSPNGPLCLPQFPVIPKTGVVLPYTFTTFGPQDLGGVISQYPVTTRPAIIGQYAYAGENISSAVGALGMFDISDPSNPKDLGVGASFIGATVDIAGETQSPVTGGPLVAISSGMAVDNTIPANVWLYDVSTPTKPVRVGAVSVSSSAMQAGIALRLFMKDQFLYASTFLQGLQVIDLSQAIPEYQQVFNTNPTQFGAAVTTEGDGFAMDTIVNTIQLPTTTGGTATMFDLKADDFTVASGGTQTLIAATGQLPLVLADPTLTGSSAVLYPPAVGGNFSLNPVQPLLLTSADGKTNSLLCSGRAVALGSLPFTDNSGNSTTKHVAVVVGTGATGPASITSSCSASGIPALMVVDLSAVYSQGSPFTPQPMGFLQLPTTPTDVSINGTVALVATGSNVILVNLENPAQPVLGGQITGNFGNWLTTNSSGLIVGSSVSPSSGVQVSSLDVVPILTATPDVSVDDLNGATAQDVTLNYTLSGPLDDVGQATITITDDQGNNLFSTNVPVQPNGQVVWPAGQVTSTPPTPVEMALFVTNPDGSSSAPAFLTVAGTEGSVQNPVLTAVSPSRIVIGSGDTQLTATGQNFVATSTVVVGPDTASPEILQTKYVSSTQLTATIPQSLLTSTNIFNVAVETGDLTSNSLPVRVVQAGLPPSPVLSSLSLTQVQATDGAADLTITLSGSNFVNGDSQVMTNFSSIPLTSQFISSTQMQATIPGGWLITPDDLDIDVQSAQDATLASQSLVLQILDSNGLDYDVNSPQPPVITSAGSGGMLPLVPPDQTEQIVITGNRFQPGAQVFAQIDGDDPIALQTISVASGQATAIIDSNTWGAHSYNATLALVSKNGTKKQKSVSPISKEQVVFDRADQKNICDGFHSVKLDNVKPKFILRSQMIQLAQPPHTMLARVPKKLIKSGGVTFSVVPESGGNVSIDSSMPTSPNQKIAITGTTPDQITPLYTQILSGDPAVQVDAKLNGKVVGLLNVDILPRRTRKIALHIVSELNNKLVPTSVPATADIQNYLNQVYGDQTNLEFVVVPPPTGEAIHYDLNKDGQLTIPAVVQGQNDPLNSSDLQEAGTIATNLMSKDSSVVVDVYFVQKLQQSISSKQSGDSTGGFTTLSGQLPVINSNPIQSISRSSVFIADAYPNIKLHIIAHEIGHALGFPHVDTDPHSQSGDKSDTTDLMFPNLTDDVPNASTCHINIWQWRQLELNYP